MRRGLCATWARIAAAKLLQVQVAKDWAPLRICCKDEASWAGHVEQLIVREMLTVCLCVETCFYLGQAVTKRPSCVCSYETYAQVLASE